MADNLIFMYGKLCAAIEILITNHHDIRNRVWVAAPYLFAIHEDGLPKSCHENVKWIHKMLTRFPPEYPWETALRATYRRTRSVTAYKIAVKIWELYHIMLSEIEQRSQNYGKLDHI